MNGKVKKVLRFCGHIFRKKKGRKEQNVQKNRKILRKLLIEIRLTFLFEKGMIK